MQTHMQGDEHGVLPDWRVGEQQYEAHCAPNTQNDEDDGNECELHVSHGEKGRLRPVCHDGAILGQGRVLQQTEHAHAAEKQKHE